MNVSDVTHIESCITLRKLSHNFDRKKILDEVNLSISQGQFVVMLGRSGTGKSTLLRMMANLLKPASGEIVVNGELSFAFQDARLLPWEKVWKNVVFGTDFQGDEAYRKAIALLEEVGLADRADAWPATLSGGEAQRVSLARALVRDPQLLLLDEPFGALDALTRHTMQKLVIELWQRHRFTAVMVTHDVFEAVQLADRILVLDNGQFTMDVQIDAAYPRSRTDPELNRIQENLMAQLNAA